jgi:sarcosine/dimethylglycine N-methyltransferase
LANLQTHYSASGIEERILAAVRAAGLDPERGVAPEDLGALDHFHTGGRRATLELLDLVPVGADDRVLDLGAGLGGPARLLASARGCRVVCLEPSADYCAGARLLNRLTRLDHLIEVHEGSAPDLPFSDASFDVVWVQNVGMNVADKHGFRAAIRRVLKTGGRYAFQEMAAGDAGAPHFPVPWATEPADSFLVPAADLRTGLEESGFVAEVFEDTSAAELGRPSAGAAQGPLTFAVFVDNIGEKARNSRRSLEEGRIRVVRGVFRAV